MKKFGKFVFATLSVATVIGGAYYFVKNILNKNTVDDFEDFEDDFDDFEFEEDTSDSQKEDRGYVTLNFKEEENTAEEETPNETTNEAPVNEEIKSEENNTSEE